MADAIFDHICTFAFYFGLTYFIAVVAHCAADDVCSQTAEEKQVRDRAVSKRARQMAVFVAVVSTVINILEVHGNNTMLEAAQQEGIELVQEYPYEYIDEDVFRQYVADNISDIQEDYDLYSYDALEDAYNEGYNAASQSDNSTAVSVAPSGSYDPRDEYAGGYAVGDYNEDDMSAAYDDGWSDACRAYGIVEETNSTATTVAPASPTAYITPTGKRYHLSQSCAGENAIQTTIADASEKGYTACAKCAQ